MMYQTIFDITQIGFVQLWPLALGIGLTLVTFTLVFAPDLEGVPYFWLPKRVGVIMNCACFMIAAIWTAGVLYGTIDLYIIARYSLASGDYSIAQGPITDFRPLLPGDMGGSESFTVQSVTFSYSEYDLLSGFNRTKREGNPLKVGMPVRVTYKDDMILRLEVAQPVQESDGNAPKDTE